MSTQYRFAALMAAIVLVVIACAPATPMVAGRQSTPAAQPPTPVPTFTPTPATPSPTSTGTPTPTNTPAPATATPTATSTPAPTDTPKPAAPTATRRPPTATPTPPAPTDTPVPSVDFKVIEARMLTMVENHGCAGDHNFYITVLDKSGAPLNGIYVQRRYLDYIVVPPTGDKGPGKTEDEAGSGNAYRVLRDASGRTFTSEWTREMSTIDQAIPNADLIAGGYCANDADCNQRKAENQLCRKHYSYNVVFQRQ